MKNKFEILCPGRNCPKCKRLIKYLEAVIQEYHVEAEIIVHTKLMDFLKFKTWVLPSVYVNGCKVSRGYRPKKEDILNNLMK